MDDRIKRRLQDILYSLSQNIECIDSATGDLEGDILEGAIEDVKRTVRIIEASLNGACGEIECFKIILGELR